MRSAFSLLESLLALIVFSVVILVCSQTLLAIQTELKRSKEHQRKETALFNTMLYLENQLRYALILRISSQEVQYYQIHHNLFFSHSFDPYNQKCNSNRIKAIKDVQFLAFFSPFLQIAQVIKKDQQEMILDRKAECGAMIPLKQKKTIFLASNQTLYLDSFPLLKGVREFDLKQKGQEIQIRLCFDSCLTYVFLQNEIFYAF